MKIYCCIEHVDYSIDTIVDEFEDAPYVQKLEGNQCPKCQHCSENAEYIVFSNEK